MIAPLEYENCLKIGFINNINVYEINQYSEVYDALILHDGDFSLVLMILKLIAGENFQISEYPTLSEVYKLLNIDL